MADFSLRFLRSKFAISIIIVGKLVNLFNTHAMETENQHLHQLYQILEKVQSSFDQMRARKRAQGFKMCAWHEQHDSVNWMCKNLS